VAEAQGGDRPPILPVSTIIIKHVRNCKDKKINHIPTLFSFVFHF